MLICAGSVGELPPVDVLEFFGCGERFWHNEKQALEFGDFSVELASRNIFQGFSWSLWRLISRKVNCHIFFVWLLVFSLAPHFFFCSTGSLCYVTVFHRGTKTCACLCVSVSAWVCAQLCHSCQNFHIVLKLPGIIGQISVWKKSLETIAGGQTGHGKLFEEQCYLETW